MSPVLFDEPRWPAHGTVYGHLVSDSSLWELHRTAARIGLDPRAFDHDHYDLPVRLVEAARAAGAQQLPERELVQRLRAAGLRIAPGDRAPRRGRARERVAAVASTLLPPAATASLVDAYQEPHRHYHDLRHIAEMLGHLDRLARADGLTTAPDEEVLAALFHDVVYDGVAGQDEQASAEVAERVLTSSGADPRRVAEVVRLVLVTREHSPEPGDAAGARVSDADMAILASTPGRYHVSVRDIRLEHPELDDAAWRAGRGAVLRTFLGAQSLFHTGLGRQEWEPRARRNIADELHHLA